MHSSFDTWVLLVTPTPSVLCCHFTEPLSTLESEDGPSMRFAGTGLQARVWGPLLSAKRGRNLGHMKIFTQTENSIFSPDPKCKVERHFKQLCTAASMYMGRVQACAGWPSHSAARIPTTPGCPQSLHCFQDAPSSCQAHTPASPKSPSPARPSPRGPPAEPSADLPHPPARCSQLKARGPMVQWVCSLPGLPEV